MEYPIFSFIEVLLVYLPIYVIFTYMSLFLVNLRTSFTNLVVIGSIAGFTAFILERLSFIPSVLSIFIPAVVMLLLSSFMLKKDYRILIIGTSIGTSLLLLVKSISCSTIQLLTTLKWLNSSACCLPGLLGACISCILLISLLLTLGKLELVIPVDNNILLLYYNDVKNKEDGVIAKNYEKQR